MSIPGRNGMSEERAGAITACSAASSGCASRITMRSRWAVAPRARSVPVGDGSRHKAVQPQSAVIGRERAVAEGVLLVRVRELGPLTGSVRVDHREVVGAVVRHQLLVDMNTDDPAEQQVDHAAWLHQVLVLVSAVRGSEITGLP
ncbi:hypothetical protein [Streptomyces spectabilis]|uniref:hypothetical protein n=1 Tax=Streptomyces spectabilis TaxID=68270 RepID=UPI0019AB1106|nr:hypothetical protein GCM10010245_38530 [Streptomyces spectabilis]